MKEIGESFKEKREEIGITLEEVSKDLGIKEVLLENLEEGNAKVFKDILEIKDTIEAGIELSGTEIKSIRNGKINLKDSYAIIKNGEAFVYGIHISPYEFGNIYNKDPLRTRKLLLHKHEINKLFGQIQQQGVSLVPISAYFKGSKVKIQIGIGKGKKLFDKREDLKRKDDNLYIQRHMI